MGLFGQFAEGGQAAEVALGCTRVRLPAFLALVIALAVLFLFLRVAFEPFGQPGP